jgi:AmmeMemoRadiSam system protein A
VTLHLDGALRGCIGSLEAFRPLIADIADRAYAAGFRDPRFASLSEPEIGSLELDISILNPLESFPVRDEADLIARVRPGVDGLVVQSGAARGTLLPAVWESLPDPRTFIRHLKLKAGLPEDYWSPELRFSRFTTETIESPAP